MAKTTVKKTVAKKAAAKQATPEVKTFTTESLARAISAKSADSEGKAQVSITQANEIIGYFKEAVADAISAGQKVQLTGFITITPSYRNEHEGNNVLTGEQMTIPASVALSCKAGSVLKNVAKELDPKVVAAIKAKKN